MRRAEPPALGIDFGTSNSAVSSIAADGLAQLVPLEAAATTMPTAVFFNSEDHSTHFGREAIGLYLSGVEGRLMRSLKSLLGSSLLEEETSVGGGMLSFKAIISRFLGELRGRADRHLDHASRRVVIGRPVHFVDDDPAQDQRAEAALAQAAATAGFEDVSFELEPIAAALDYEQRVVRESLVLIVDIGGGTSDFTVVRLGPDRIRRPQRQDDILATTGVHIGGTDFDQQLNLHEVMPLLGFHHIGPSGREVPSPAFIDLSSWHLVHWMYTPKMVRQVRELRNSYADPRLHDRLVKVLEQRLGHRLASEVESAKIRSSVQGAVSNIDLSALEPGLHATIGPDTMLRHLSPSLERVLQCADECVTRAGLKPDALGAIYLTGGSSSLRPFRQLLAARFGATPILEGDLFGGVASGLAYAGQRR
jgi:hypothetical chaperone protein